MNASKHVSTHRMICWQIINRCNRSCSFCISQSHPGLPFPAVDQRAIVERLHHLGTKKISISGGEPFLVKQLGEISSLAGSLNIEVQITTNGDVLSRSIPEWIIVNPPLINLSFYGTIAQHRLAMDEGHRELLWDLVRQLRTLGISVGANFILSDSSICEIPDFLKHASMFGVDRILFIVYMPVGTNSDDEHPLFNAKKYAEVIQEMTSKLKIDFPQGIRIHDYREDFFFPVCDEYGQLFFSTPGSSSKQFFGNIFEDLLNVPDIGLVPIQVGFEKLWDKRLNTNQIVPL